MKYSQIRPSERYVSIDWISETFGKGTSEVVTHLGFELDMLMHVERESPTNAREIRIGLGFAEVIGKCTDFSVVLAE